MDEINNLRQVRINKLKDLIKMGIDPFPSISNRTHLTNQARKDFNSLSKSKKKITLAGRLMSKREHGKLVFSEIFDASGSFQILFKQNEFLTF